jgi:hypothetical protein
MIADPGVLNRSDIAIEAFAAELTDVAFPVALQHGATANWLELKLELWKALNSAVKNSARELCGAYGAL